MKWSILTLTMPSRVRFIARLSAVLKPQLEQYPDVEHAIRISDPTLDLGTNRQHMIDASAAEYICFCDDDDLVPANYVSTIRPLLDGVDYVGFNLQMWVDQEKQKPTHHSLKYKEWNGDKDAWYRDISHINPIRRELALRAKMRGGHGEDERWASALRGLGIVKTEHYIDKVMYLYMWRSNKSDTPPAPHPAPARIWIENSNPRCPKCDNRATGFAGGMRNCNQCGERWI